MLSKNTQNKTRIFILLTFCLTGLCLSSPAWANNLSISNVSLEDRDATANTVIVEFDISWDNSWRSASNHDAVWVILKASINSGSEVQGVLKNGGLTPTGSSPGSNSNLEIYVPADKMGAFVRRNSTGTGTSASSNVRLKLDYGTTGAADTDTLTVKVIGIEMVFIPQEPFYAGDTSSAASLKQGASDTDPWYIANEAAINVTAAASNGFYYVNGTNSGEASTGAVFTIPAAFPKGYAAFYCMKYQVSEAQWAEFINNIESPDAQDNRDITDNNNGGKNADSVLKRNTLSQSGAAAATTRPDRAMSYLSWMDLSAYLDWVALRPMTELEFEKVARGGAAAVSGEFAWGSTNLTAAAAISGTQEDGRETITTSNGNANYNSTSLTGGDAALGAEYTQGPLRAGIFAKSNSTRESAGAGYYGVMELSGDLWERVVTIGNATGRSFTGNHGDGMVATTASYEGNANVTDWVETDGTPANGITGAIGAGQRGGAWDSSSTALSISDRSKAADPNPARANNFGGRGVRTYDGN